MAKTAEERGMEMMMVPMKNLPPIAVAHANKMCNEVGMCMEVLLTCWIVYAQIVEGLVCTDELYKARQEDVAWYKEQQQADAQ